MSTFKDTCLQNIKLSESDLGKAVFFACASFLVLKVANCGTGMYKNHQTYLKGKKALEDKKNTEYHFDLPPEEMMETISRATVTELRELLLDGKLTSV